MVDEAGGRRPFLTARWEHLIVANWAVEPSMLAPLVPAGTTLDLWHGEALVSLVGFHFRDTRLRGIAVPAHRDFEEVNLRFYVSRDGPDGVLRRAVVFIREIVPKPMVALVARWTYNEPYVTATMSHRIDCSPGSGGALEYRWHRGGQDYRLAADVRGPAAPLVAGSEAEFVIEHYWGYTRQRDGGTLEYRVEHPPWRVWPPAAFAFDGDARALYGEPFGPVLQAAPRSVYVADGSAVRVHAGTRVA